MRLGAGWERALNQSRSKHLTIYAHPPANIWNEWNKCSCHRTAIVAWLSSPPHWPLQLSGSASDGCLKSFKNIASQRFLKKLSRSYLYGKGRSMNYRRWLTGLKWGNQRRSLPQSWPICLVSGCASHKGTAGPLRTQDMAQRGLTPSAFSEWRDADGRCSQLLRNNVPGSQGWLRKYWRTASSLGKEVFCCCCCC